MSELNRLVFEEENQGIRALQTQQYQKVRSSIEAVQVSVEKYKM